MGYILFCLIRCLVLMQAGMLKILSYTWALKSPETHQPSKSSLLQFMRHKYRIFLALIWSNQNVTHRRSKENHIFTLQNLLTDGRKIWTSHLHSHLYCSFENWSIHYSPCGHSDKSPFIRLLLRLRGGPILQPELQSLHIHRIFIFILSCGIRSSSDVVCSFRWCFSYISIDEKLIG